MGDWVESVAQRTRLKEWREGVHLSKDDLEEELLGCVSERKGGVANLYKEVTVFVIWGDRVPGCVASKHAYLFTLFKYLTTHYYIETLASID